MKVSSHFTLHTLHCTALPMLHCSCCTAHAHTALHEHRTFHTVHTNDYLYALIDHCDAKFTGNSDD